MIAIHERKGSFSDRWIKYCQINKVPYKVVNCNASDIVSQLVDCNGLMWHWSHGDYRAQNYARQLIHALEAMGKKVFPNVNTCWHYDDKVGQKYLLEAIGAPMVPSFVFYDKKDAMRWAEGATYPKVFKLRGGAGSTNVSLVRDITEAKKVISKSFDKGFKAYSKVSSMRERFWRLKRDKSLKSAIGVIKGFGRLFIPTPGLNLLQDQKGYVYFQEFIPDNTFDDRVVVIGNRALFLRRGVRQGDFRASGSGLLKYDRELLPEESLKIAFEVSKKLNTQSLAFDFVYDKGGNPLIVELSYAYSMGKAYDDCPGYWDSDLVWHDKLVDPQRFIIEDFIASLSYES